MGRLTTQTDVDNYNAAIVAEGMTPMQVGDVIFFLSERNPNGNLYDNKQAYPTARLGATIWFEGGVDSYDAIDIGTQTSGEVTVPTDADNPCHIHFFGGQGQVLRDTGGLAGREFQIFNIDHLIVDFETNSHPGLRDGWGSGKSGTFGVKVQNIVKTKSGMALKVDHTGHTMKWLEIRGCELTMGSFAKVRALLAENHMDKLIVERNLITRSVGGEGLYMGQTSRAGDDNWNSINYLVRNNIFAFTAAEALQLQQLADGSRVYNNVIYIADHDFKAAFQTNQDTGVQLDIIQGDVHFFNNIIYGHGTAGIQFFGKDGSPQGISWGTKRTKCYNNLLGGAKKGISLRVHESFRYGQGALELRDNDIIEPKRGYYDEIDDQANYYAEIGNDLSLPVHTIGGNAPDDAIPYFNPGKSNGTLKSFFNVNRGDVPTPEFVNTGFDNIDVHNISRWSELYEVGRYWGYTEGNGNNPDDRNIVDMSTLSNGGSITFTNVNHTDRDWVVGDKMKVEHNSGDRSFYGTVAEYTGTSITINNLSHIVGTGVTTADVRWNFLKFRQYEVGQFVWLAEDGENLDMNLYKCIQAHEAVVGNPEARRPDQDATRWELVWWDVNGKNMYDPAYNGTPHTTDFMEVAGDFRLVKGSYHHLKGRGLLCNEQRDDQTMMGWQWKQTESGTVRDIPGAYGHQLRISDYSYLKSGRYYRFWVEKLKSDQTFEDRVYSDWQQIP